MGREKIRRPLYLPEGAEVDVDSGATGTTIDNEGVTQLSNSTAGGIAVFNLEGPDRAGQRKGLFALAVSTSTGTDSIQVKASSTGAVTFDGTNHVATLDAAGEALGLVAASTTRWLALNNQGSVSFGAST